MKLTHLVVALVTTACAGATPGAIFANPVESNNRIPTAKESAILGRRILSLVKLGTLSTVF